MIMSEIDWENYRYLEETNFQRLVQATCALS